MKEWTNWSGFLRFTPQTILEPESEDELTEIIKQHYKAGKRIKLAAAGHSSSPLVETPDTLVTLEHFKGLVKINDDGTAVFRPGTTVNEANDALKREGRTLFNTGDVDVQTLAGAFSTGTHGTGKTLPILSTMLRSVRMIDYSGALRIINDREDSSLMKAVRLSLGALGLFTEIEVRTEPLFKLRRQEICVDINACMEHFDQLANEHRNVDFYWYPRSDETKIRILTAPEKDLKKSLVFKHLCKEDQVGWAGDVLPKNRELKFDEMEYALPYESAMECFRQIRTRIKERHREHVAWRVLFRTIAADDNYLSPHYKRASASISLHHNAGLPFHGFFNDIEPIFRQYGGRPHWAKQHNLKAADLRKLYPEWDKFHECRKRLDPEEFYLNKYLRKLFHDE